MPLGYTSYTGNGSLQLYSVPFNYIAQSHVHVYLDTVETTAFTWPTSATIQFTVAPANGVVILISRETPKDGRLVNFENASLLQEAVMDKDSDQLFFILQEQIDNFGWAQDNADAAAVSAAEAASHIGEPAAHALSHVDGSDDIQSATNTQKGLATAPHIVALEAATSKLSGIAEGANNYSHPAAHAISVITGLQDALDAKAASSHSHDDLYYPKGDIDTMVGGFAKVNTGQYTGNGQVYKSILGVGFLPKFIYVSIHAAAGVDSAAFLWHEYLGTNLAIECENNNLVANAIIEALSDGFKVDDDGADAHPNKDDQLYDYICFG